ncbi:N-acetylglucosamine kinase [Paractinoplanes toevensis]|uniref:N-acetylglucosamine kinase n=1 Tax=Paractinoplanes toevensis TaxID=571911 RepID=A0A919TGM3_9ACTN|nr:BadF/BadG/BcrA/BcrD ATPase family protein [Actinoplanes toevensis]GIM95303.1 N-acetylglucosamine kinase [Actinoplanes toevensis]
MDLVVGVDAGGTASRAVVATLDGAIVGRGAAGPGNPLSGGVSAASAIGVALRSALSGCDPSRVAGGVLGVAGTSVVTNPVIADAFEAMWFSLGLRCPMRIVGDVVTAFAAGTPSPSGAALIAGTGAVAARLNDHAVIAVADGFGWLLGDEGSGRWMGLQALRSAVRDWPSTLAGLVAAHAGVTSADALIHWAQGLPFPAIDGLAPVVCAAARAGDPDAERITTAAAGQLLATLDQVAEPGAPVVLAGGLLAAETPVRESVLAALRTGHATVGTSTDPAAAAAWLAARPLSALSPPALHTALLG